MADVHGNQASFTWSTGPAIAVADGHAIRFAPAGTPHDVTRFGDIAPRYSQSLVGGTVTLRVFHSDAGATPPAIPDNTVGTLVFTPATGQTATVTALMVGYSHSAQSVGGAPPQTVDYQLLITATGNVGTAAITLA